MNATSMLRMTAIAAAMALAAGCGDDGDNGMGPDPGNGNEGGNNGGEETPMGTIQVTTVTVGVQIDPDGYAFQVDGGPETPIGANDVAVLDVPAGDHVITLTGIQTNCDPVNTSWDVSVSEGYTTSMAFQMDCVPYVTNRIVFESTRAGNNELFAMDPDGSNVVQLTTVNGAREPAVSPDGRTVAFNVGYELWAMDADGGNLRLLASDGNNPAWSPDGSRIAYNAHSATSSSRDIHLMNPDGTNVVVLNNTFQVQETQPSWSPDGQRIAYRRLENLGKSDIYVMNADGSNAADLLGYAGDESFPSWSPDGLSIAYVSTRCRAVDLYPCGDNEVHVAAADGSTDRFVTSTLVEDMRPSWSPDGSKLAFDSAETGDEEVYVMDADGKNRTQITSSTGYDRIYPQSWAR
jgi:Tol biopolymer transport system component